jgi:2-dehydro-3-deoxyphosphogalactonate aldolase
MTDTDRASLFDASLASLPLVAILRGLKPQEAEGIGAALYGAGFRLIEVPLNSPEPFRSIEILRRSLGPDVLVGAGTVLDVADVARLAAIKADLVVMPHADVAVITAAKARGMICVPGVMTPTEAFAALRAGADALKLFPAELISPVVVKAIRAVLPKGTRLLPVGGIGPQSMRPYLDAGVVGFGLGSAVYVPGMTAADVAAKAQQFVEAWTKTRGAGA